MFGFAENTLIEHHNEPTYPSVTAPGSRVTVTPARAPSKASPSVFDTLPKLRELRKDDDDRGNLIELLWEATDTYEPAKLWIPKTHALNALKRTDRRWGPLVGGALAIVVILVSSFMLWPEPAITPGEVAAASTDIAITESVRVLADVQTVSLLLIDPAASGADLSNAAITLTDLDSFSRDLLVLADSHNRANQPSEAALASEAGATGIGISDRLSLILSYRLTFSRVLVLPEMPTESATVAISDIGFSLASTISDSYSALEDLPLDPSLNGQTLAADEAIDLIEALTVDYLQALRDSDSLAAQVISNEIRITSEELHAQLPMLLTEVQTSVQSDLASFSASLEKLDQ